MESEQLNIGLNLLHALPEIGGGWNYIANLVAAIAECDQQNRYTAFVTKKSSELVPSGQNFESVQINLNASSRPLRVIYENTILQWQTYQRKLDVLHWFSNTHAVFNAVPSAVTVYDLQSFVDVADYSRQKRIYLKFMVSRTAKKANALLPMSEATASDLRDRFDIDDSRVTIVPHVLGGAFRPAEQMAVENLRKKFSLPEFFWLYVAHMYVHKNHQRLLEALSTIKKRVLSSWSLVLRGDDMGGLSQINHTLRKLGLEKDVIFLTSLSEEELATLYSAAQALVYPSIYEGGGIPVIEAMACGCPVIASDIPAIREFAADAALYFDPYDVSDVVEKMLKFRTDVERKKKLREKGFQRAALCTKETVVQRVLKAYTKIAQE